MNKDNGQHLLGRHQLKSFASGTAHLFASSAAHYAWLTHHYGIARSRLNSFRNSRAEQMRPS
uniref:Uncharacterized protein n=1 Tax=Geobacter metallireducens TaxID=28232 RepID=A0A831XM64_GEOME